MLLPDIKKEDMEVPKLLNYIKDVVTNMPADWLGLTTHRLDIYEEQLAKSQFLEHLQDLFDSNNSDRSVLQELPTAYDYIRLGHPLSCILEWVIAQSNNLPSDNVISFSSNTIPVLAILRHNTLIDKHTKILYTGALPEAFDTAVLRDVYGYRFDLKQIEDEAGISLDEKGDSSTLFISQQGFGLNPSSDEKIDFYINILPELGSVVMINGDQNNDYVPTIQHVRRRETIAMTPANCLKALNQLIGQPTTNDHADQLNANKTIVLDTIKNISASPTKALLGSCGLSIQYAITMGLIHDALVNHKGKAIKIIVPTNCYGGTNDQARRVAACLDHVEVVDLAVDGGKDMVESIDTVLEQIAQDDAIPYIIAEIPTNPRVEVPDLIKLKEVLSRPRQTATGTTAIDPVFILDQTFCPNVHFLGEGGILSTVRTIAYISGSKFPSGGKCTAGYCIGNTLTTTLMDKVELHLRLCDNGATPHQIAILAKQMPSMNQRINKAYQNTRAFVNHISETLPDAKINFVSEELAAAGFTPSVFSLDLPTKGTTAAEKESYKRALNHKLINLMITEIPNESKHCVSYGQLQGCYWTIPATSTQGTTKEGDKDYIARISLSPDMDVELHKKVFGDFAKSI